MKLPSYIKIFQVLGDTQWHDFTDICNPFVAGKEGDRRLREMKERGWIDYGWRYKPQTHTSQYRLFKIFPAFWNYYQKFSLELLVVRTNPQGQMEFVNT